MVNFQFNLLYILVTPKCILLQTVKTQMKCRIGDVDQHSVHIRCIYLDDIAIHACF